MSYVDEVLEVVKKKNADQPEFLWDFWDGSSLSDT